MPTSDNALLPKWNIEFNAITYKYHVLVCWVAVIFDPLFAVSDYFTSPNHFNEFLAARLITVAAIFIVSNIVNKRYAHVNPEVVALTPFLAISFQNAFMYSVMSVAELQTHTFAYITMFIGAGMFVLWNIRYSIIVVALNYIANIILFRLNSPLTLDEILINGGLLTGSVALFSIFLIQLRTNLTKKEIIARLALEESNKLILEKSFIIEEKNKEINDSISYAQRIQRAVLPKTDIPQGIIDDCFVLFKPKDKVSGDFVWYTRAKNGQFIIAVVDCTGHGVPGAMVSIVCNNALNKTVLEHHITEPGKILDKARELLQEAFSGFDIQDGMDISIISIDVAKQEIMWAGANNGLIYISNAQIHELKASKQPVGKTDNPTPFVTHVLPYQKGDVYYLFSDGYADQFGGPMGKKFKIKVFKELLFKIAEKPMNEQHDTLLREFELWKGNAEQTDDVCVIGLKV